MNGEVSSISVGLLHLGSGVLSACIHMGWEAILWFIV